MNVVKTKLVEVRFPTISRALYDVVHPFEESPQISVVRFKSNVTPTQGFSMQDEVANGVVYDWQMGVWLLPNQVDLPVYTTPNLPQISSVPNNYLSYDVYQAWKNINDPTGPNLLGKIHIDNSAIKYFPVYHGIKLRVFKYTNRVYMLTNDGRNAKRVAFDKNLTVWEAFVQTAQVDPNQLFEGTLPHGKCFYNFVLGGKHHYVTGTRPVSNNYLVHIYAQNEMSYVNKGSLPVETLAEFCKVDSFTDNLYAPLGYRKGMCSVYLQEWFQRHQLPICQMWREHHNSYKQSWMHCSGSL